MDTTKEKNKISFLLFLGSLFCGCLFCIINQIGMCSIGHATNYNSTSLLTPVHVWENRHTRDLGNLGK